jgi:hypothetical protein
MSSTMQLTALAPQHASGGGGYRRFREGRGGGASGYPRLTLCPASISLPSAGSDSDPTTRSEAAGSRACLQQKLSRCGASSCVEFAADFTFRPAGSPRDDAALDVEPRHRWYAANACFHERASAPRSRTVTGRCKRMIMPLRHSLARYARYVLARG